MGEFDDQLAAQAALSRSINVDSLEGIVVAGSYDPSQGTVEVTIGDTAAVFTDQGDTPITLFCNLLTPGLGAQYGPVGGERATVFRTQSGYSALIEHGPDDSPGIIAGEWGIAHRNADGVYDSFVKLTNDGPTPNDGLGGTQVGGLGALTQVGTSDPTLQSAYDATAGTLVHQAGDVAKVVHDKALGQIGMGDAPGNLTADDAAAAKTHLDALTHSIIETTVQTVVSQLLDVFTAQGVPNTPAVAVIVQATGWVKNLPGIFPTIPDCSQITRIKSS